MILPPDIPVLTNHLRHAYQLGDYTFCSPAASTTVCLVGSCRIIPLLNHLRAYNQLNGHPFKLLCLNPVEMWEGPGHEVSDGVNATLTAFPPDLSGVDILIGEHLARCGPLNTDPSAEQNIFRSLNCSPSTTIRLPNWHGMLFYDYECALFDPAYASLDRPARVSELRLRAAHHKARFLGRCERSSFPDLAQWVQSVWTTHRLGWTLDHVAKDLSLQFLHHIAASVGFFLSPELLSHPFLTADTYSNTGTSLTPVDREANGWTFQ